MSIRWGFGDQLPVCCRLSRRLARPTSARSSGMNGDEVVLHPVPAGYLEEQRPAPAVARVVQVLPHRRVRGDLAVVPLVLGSKADLDCRHGVGIGVDGVGGHGLTSVGMYGYSVYSARPIR